MTTPSLCRNGLCLKDSAQAANATSSRFPEGPSRQIYSDIQFTNSAYWGLSAEQIQDEGTAVSDHDTDDSYEMRERLVDMFGAEESSSMTGVDSAPDVCVPPSVSRRS